MNTSSLLKTLMQNTNLIYHYFRLMRCPKTFRGKYLSWLNGLRTKTLSSDLTSVPLITMNGKYSLQPVDLREQICQYLEDPKPEEC